MREELICLIYTSLKNLPFLLLFFLLSHSFLNKHLLSTSYVPGNNLAGDTTPCSQEGADSHGEALADEQRLEEQVLFQVNLKGKSELGRVGEGNSQQMQSQRGDVKADLVVW